MVVIEDDDRIKKLEERVNELEMSVTGLILEKSVLLALLYYNEIFNNDDYKAALKDGLDHFLEGFRKNSEAEIDVEKYEEFLRSVLKI